MTRFPKRIDIIEKYYEDENITYKIEKTADYKIKVTIYWGRKPNAGYRIKISNIEHIGNIVNLKYIISYPHPGMLYNDVITTPSDSIELEIKDSQEAPQIKLINEKAKKHHQ